MSSIKPSEIKYTFIRSPGPGGQNVNKVATGVQLRFNILNASGLSEVVRVRLFSLAKNRITSNGDLIIKATSFRTQERNKQDAFERLQDLITRASIVPKKRKKTKPSRAATERRLTKKKLHGKNKLLRGKGRDWE